MALSSGITVGNKVVAKDQSMSARVDNNHAILLKFWTRGMIALHSPEEKALVQMACDETGLAYQQVKDWISNHKRREKKKMGCLRFAEKCSKLRARKVSARDIFYREQIPKLTDIPATDRFTTVARMWAAAKHSGVAAAYQYRAETESQSCSSSEISDTQKQQLTKKNLHEIGAIINKLQQFGTETLVLTFDPLTGQTGTLGSVRGLEYTKHAEAGYKFSTFMSGNIVESKTALKVKVRDLFNAKYYDCLGRRHVEYAKIKAGEILVSGMPDGIAFRKPTSYGDPALKTILADSANLKFQRVSAVNEHAPLSPSVNLTSDVTVTTSTSTTTTTASKQLPSELTTTPRIALLAPAINQTPVIQSPETVTASSHCHPAVQLAPAVNLTINGICIRARPVVFAQ